MRATSPAPFRWLPTGDDAFAAMLAAIAAATTSVDLEFYKVAADTRGQAFRHALVQAQRRGARVRVVLDAFGSRQLPADFWEPLTATGGRVGWFNPRTRNRLGRRDHRKILVCDGRVAFVGGVNLTTEYEGDGVTRGWRDLGAQIQGPLAEKLAAAFDAQFRRVTNPATGFARWRTGPPEKTFPTADGDLLLSGTGRGRQVIKQSLLRDLRHASRVQIISAYFLPTWRLRRALMRLARRGAVVQLILAGQSDVPLAQLASQHLYARLLRAGVEIYEYQPQILHAKLVRIDQVVYVGSANLDTRSLNINDELLLRLPQRALAAEAGEIFAGDLERSRRIDPAAWRASRTIWRKLQERWAYFLVARVDPYLARW